MAHTHENCLTPQPSYFECHEGLLFGYCGADDCPYPDCTVVGHCDCNCHSGKTCGCDYEWPR